MARTAYPAEFRRRVIELVEGGRKISEVSRELGVSQQTIYVWRRQAPIDVVFRWEPNSYCHFHRHLVDTTTTVLQGEHYVVEMEHGVELEHRVRLAGAYAHKPAGDVHMEYAGPAGSLLLFNMYAPDGRLFEILDVLSVATIEDLVTGRIAG